MPQLSSIGGYFVSSDFDHILRGYCYEGTRNGAYVWRFVYPLFDKFDSMSLLYSFRLPENLGYINFQDDGAGDIADEFLSKISQYDKGASEVYSVDEFCHYCVDRPGLIRHEHVALHVGYGYVLLRRQDEALSQLSYAVTRLREPFLSDGKRLLELARDDLDSARREVLSFESEVRRKLGLPAGHTGS